jgi:large conductance mechanosensitive channel
MGIVREFKDFAIKGNMIDMAVGIIIGGAFGKIVASLVNDVIMPPIGLLMGGVNFNDKFLNLGKGEYATLAAAKQAGEPTLNYGAFAQGVLDFLIVAFCIFIIIKQINRLKREPPPADPTTKECGKCLMTIPIKATRCGHCTSDL